VLVRIRNRIIYSPIKYLYVIVYSMTDRTRECINLGSYNYLSMTEKDSPCLPGALKAVKKYGVGNCAQGRLFGNSLEMKIEMRKNMQI